MIITGKITIRPFAKGSKSERDAVYIDTDKGSYVLQKTDENPFERSPLHELEGKTVQAVGELDKYLFLAREVKEIN